MTSNNVSKDFSEIMHPDKSKFITGVVEEIKELGSMCAIFSESHTGKKIFPIAFCEKIPNSHELKGWNFEIDQELQGVFKPKMFMKIAFYRYVVGKDGVDKEVRTYSFKKSIDETSKLIQESGFYEILENY